jgi:5'-3' exonuclease
MACDWLLVDGSSLIFRAFHGVPQEGAQTDDGRLVNAVRGFLDRLARLLTQRQPRRLAIADDADWRPQWRVALLPSYKTHRAAEPVPPALVPQLPIIRDVLTAIGIEMVGLPDYEAEDLIATWSAHAEGSIEIASGDRDLFALIEESRIVVLYPERTGMAVVDEAEVTRRYGIPGRQYADFAVLRGDPSDGLPGLRGVGERSAAELIRRYGSVAAMLGDAASRLSDSDRDYLTRALRVVSPRRDLAIALPAGRRDRYPADPATLNTLIARNGLAGPCARLVAALSALPPLH